MQELEDFKPLQSLDGPLHMDANAGDFVCCVALCRRELNDTLGFKRWRDKEGSTPVDIFLNVGEALVRHHLDEIFNEL